MPLIHATLSSCAMDPRGRRAFVAAITEAAMQAESVPDTPDGRRRCVVIVRDQPPESMFFGAEPAEAGLRAVFVDFICSTGVLDAVRKERFAAALQVAAEATTRPGEARPIATSVIFDEVPEGQWGREGGIRRLPDMARAARFAHLLPIAAP